MTISTTTSKVSYTGNGSTDVFAYTFKIFADSEVTVYVDGVLKSLTTHYTVSGAGSASGGNVTFTTGNTPADTKPVVILRNITKTQLTDYVENDSFPAETHESALDKLTMLIQDVDNAVTGDIFRFSDSVGDAGTVTITKTASERASKVLAFDTSGNLQADQEIGTFKGNWAASTAYAIRDIIKDTSNNNIYICNTVHTSSGSQPISSNTDVAKWNLIVDAASATTSATSASSSASTATTQAGIATTQAGIATAKAVLTASDATDTAADLVETAADVVLAEAAKVSAEAATGALAFKFTFDNSTSMADPSAGELRLNHGTVASVTAITFDAVSADTSNPDVSDYIASWDDGSNSTHEGYITIRKSGTPATYAVFSLTGAVTDNTGYLTAVVTHVDSNGSWTNGDTMYVSFARSGNVGATGPSGGVGNELADNVFRIQDNGDATKEIAFEASGISSGTTRTITMPDANVTLVVGALANLSEDSSPALGGFLDANGNYIQMQKGGDISSASPTVIDTDGDYFICTGTTGFSAMTVAADRHFFLEFAGALTMTHGAGTLDLPSGANITTVAGDVAEFVSTASNVVTCVNYTKASGKAPVESVTLSNSVTLTNKTLTAPAVTNLTGTFNSPTGTIGAVTLGGAVTGGDQTVTAVNLKDYGEITSALGSAGGSRTIDLNDGNSFTATVSSSTVTWTFSNPTASDEGCGFTLVLTNGGSETVNWPSAVDWAGGDAPDLTESGVDVLTFWTVDAGTTWYGFAASLDNS
jgi:hypothetical protein